VAVLGPAMKVLARRLLTWDRARVAQHEQDGYDCAAYRARQDLMEACIEIDADAWPQEIRIEFTALLEITRTPTKAREQNIGPLKPVVTRLSLAERLAYRALADAIGVRERLREVAPRQWADVDTEGP
jgi:hypothetical protein